MMQSFCQWLVVVGLTLRFLSMVHQNFGGERVPLPTGFEGFMLSCFVTGIKVLILIGAGAFSMLIY